MMMMLPVVLRDVQDKVQNTTKQSFVYWIGFSYFVTLCSESVSVPDKPAWKVVNLSNSIITFCFPQKDVLEVGGGSKSSRQI